MKKKLTIMLFSLLLAVGWTNDAQAQLLPAETHAKKLVDLASWSNPALTGTMDHIGTLSHSHDAVTPNQTVNMLNKKNNSSFKELTDLPAVKSKAQTAVKSEANRPSNRHYSPMRAGQVLDMKSITKDEANAITYTWTDAEGSHSSKATDVAKTPEQMYELLRLVYMDKRFPGPYYSAYTKNDVRERKVYYGAIEGGWNIGGDVLPNPTPTTQTVNGDATLANGTNTNNTLPANGYYQDYGYRSQMIYTASQLSAQGIQSGDEITSLTFYPSAGLKFYGSSIRLSLGNTNTSNFGTYSSSSASMITSGLTQVASLNLTATNTSATEWTFTFDQPYTYTGGNLVVQVQCQGYRHDGTTGSYDSSGNRTSFYGQNQSAYQSNHSYGSSSTSGQNNTTGSNSQFLPKAKFNYQRTVTNDPYNTIGDITITTDDWDVLFRSITLYDENNNVLTSWNSNGQYYTQNNQEYYYIPDWGFDVGNMFRLTAQSQGTTYAYGYLPTGDGNPGSIFIPHYLLAGHSSVRVVITALNDGDSPNITIDGITKTVNAQSLSGATLEWTIQPKAYAHTDYDPDYYLPNEEGYTALIVAVKNSGAPFDLANYDTHTDNAYFDTKAEIINYLANNVDSIRLLTDGMRIGEGDDYSIGTLFNCEGTYNKFFFLGKGQARQKPDVIRDREIFRQTILGEYYPFRFMFEEFSPTSGAEGSQTEDFYSKMNEGNVYNVQHDCRSVIALEHQFSMSGNAGTTAYAMTGMNFFIPDYRLKYWEDQYNTNIYDGRIQNPYQTVSADGNPEFNRSLLLEYPVNHAAWYAVYNALYPPKVGLYKITLDADATQVAYDYSPGNQNFAVTLTWVSSLDEMTGHEVPQTYTVYFWDPVTGEKKFLVVEGVTTVNGETGETTLTYYVEQFSHSYTIDYIVEGRPEDSEHSQFVAVSNVDGVIIPGWDDFVGLQLDHHESDFIVSDMANYYRNFLVVLNEDMYNGLTVADVTGYNENDPSTPLTPMNTFNLYRWAIKNGVAQGEEKVAVLEFDKANASKVHYNVYYEDSEDPDHTDLTEQQILQKPKYSRSSMGIIDDGWIRVKGNGDIIIWPNGYHVNFKSIVVKNNGSVLTSWNADNQNTLTNGWIVSPGSKWEEYVLTTNGDKVGYMEGGGYIAIPDMLNNYNNLSVEIVAYGDGAAVTRINVNDDSKLIANTPGITYTWNSPSPNALRASDRATVTETVTVHENASDNNRFMPLMGYYYDYRQQWSQCIYTANQLGDLAVGDVIKAITFYPTVNTLNYNSGVIHVAMGTTTQSSFTEFVPLETADFTEVATYVPNGNINCSNGWTITFDTPFTYTGNNLYIEFFTEIGDDYTDSYFYGVNTSVNNGFWVRYESDGWSGNYQQFQPKITFTYETEGETPPDPSDPTTLEPTDAGMLRLHLLMVDQFKEEIPDNNGHPEAYGYILRYEPQGGEAEESSKVRVNIEKTEAQVNSYYTLSDIESDIDRHLETDVLTADVSMNLPSENPDVLYYEMQGKKDADPALGEDYLTQLQYMKNISKYEEMLETSPNRGHQYNANETYHYFDPSTPIVKGTYGVNFMTYAPSVSTWGIDRRYFEDDGLDNTYGAPIWKTGVGQVRMISTEAQLQRGPYESTQWDGVGGPCSLVFLGVEALGDLPSPDVSNIVYEPYMFRVWIQSPQNNLRGCTLIPENLNDPDKPGEHWEGDGTVYGAEPIMVYEGLTTDGHLFIDVEDPPLDNQPWPSRIQFGALDTGLDDLIVYVRFYYKSTGRGITSRDSEVPEYNASEGEDNPNITTGIIELWNEFNHGEAVSTTYVNSQGMTSDKPFDGINIVVTRYSNGTTRTTKMIH